MLPSVGVYEWLLVPLRSELIFWIFDPLGALSPHEDFNAPEPMGSQETAHGEPGAQQAYLCFEDDYVDVLMLF